MVCAYVIAISANGMTAREAIDIVKAKRGIVNPNEGFRAQLAKYAERYVGNGAPGQSGAVAPSPIRTAARIGDGIAAHIRRLKSGAIASSSRLALQKVEVEDAL